MRRAILSAVTCIVLTLVAPTPIVAEDSSLVGHWPLAGNARDLSRYGNHATEHPGVDWSASGPTGNARSAATLNGRDHYLEVPHAASLELDRRDFTVAVWLDTDSSLDDVLGDILSKYDSQARTGFQLSLLCNPGVTTHQPNYRQLAFGIDAGTAGTEWIDCGRPGNAVLIFALCVHRNHLYAGTCEPGADDAGHVYRYEGGNQWVDCGAPDRSNAVSSLAVHRGRLYAGVAKYRLRGSALTESDNRHPGGRVYRFQGGTSWQDCGSVGPVDAVNGMAVYRDRLYASAMYHPGLFRYEGGTTWAPCGSPDRKRVESLGVHNGHLYATGYDEGAVYRYDGPNRWTHLGRLGQSTQTYGLATYGGLLHVSTWPGGKVFACDEDHRWMDKGRLADQLEVMAMAVYNGQLYAGSLPSAGVFRYAGGARWELTGYLDTTPDVRYRRAWSMAVFDGKLFCGTLPSGHVLSMEAGKSVTYGAALDPGWRHVVASRDSRRLKLYVDGQLVAESTEFEPEDYDVTTVRPLWIGRGTTDVLNGRLADVRLYRRALTAEQVLRLSRASGASEAP